MPARAWGFKSPLAHRIGRRPLTWSLVLQGSVAPGQAQVSEVNILAPRSIEDIKARADEFADAFENYDPKPGDQDAPIPPVMAVELAAWRRDSAERELADAVRSAREQRLSWREVGEAIGTSGEAARQRYGASA